MKQLFRITGMTCKSCKALIEGEVSAVEGVIGISVSLKDGTAEVDLRPHSVSDVMKTISDLGYVVWVEQ